MPDCQSSGCLKRTTGYSRYCNAHKARDGRHGDPRQETVTAHRLKGYVQLVRGWVARQRQDNIWNLLDGVWNGAMDQARAMLAEHAAGRPGLRHEVQAAADMVRIARGTPTRLIVETLLAIAVMREMEPRAFQTDRAFWHQAARRFRGLSDVHVGSYWDHRQGRVKRVYRDPNPRAAEALGRRLVCSLGPVGEKIVASEAAQRERRASANAALAMALKRIATEDARSE